MALIEKFAYVIAFKGDKFVMVRHKERAWEMPGGRLQRGEDFEQAATLRDEIKHATAKSAGATAS